MLRSYSKITGNRSLNSNLLFSVELFILFSGIFLRFYFQFIEWSINGDEINLASNIIDNTFPELLGPLDHQQSAPPLFLWIEKLSLLSGNPRIDLKILPFLSSVISLLLFNRLSKRNLSSIYCLIPLSIFAFSPFIIHNSLTIKQYTFDLLFSLIAVNYFMKTKNKFRELLFFTVWCLISNIGLFFCAAFILYNSYIFLSRKISILELLKNCLPYLVAPLPYLLYFLWFNSQEGAPELKSYMIHYWAESFMPLSAELFRWAALQINAIRLFIFSSYYGIGIAMLLIFVIGIFAEFDEIKKVPNSKNVILLFLLVLLVHLSLSAMRLYPFSDRLILYLSPFFILGFGKGIAFISTRLLLKKQLYLKYLTTGSLILVITASYATYVPRKGNNLEGMGKYLNSQNRNIYITEKARIGINLYTNFSKDSLLSKKIRNTNSLSKNRPLFKNDLIISRQSLKFGHLGKRSPPEPEIRNLLNEKKLNLKKEMGDYVIYQFKPPLQP